MWELEILSVAPGVSASWISDDPAPPGICALRCARYACGRGLRTASSDVELRAGRWAGSMARPTSPASLGSWARRLLGELLDGYSALHSQGNVPAGGRVSGGELGFTAVGHAATMSATPQERCAEHVRINADMRGRADKMSPC